MFDARFCNLLQINQCYDYDFNFMLCGTKFNGTINRIVKKNLPQGLKIL